MICKNSVLKWFKGLNSHNRMDLMCSLLNKCLPFELRFLGTCLEDLGRQHFTQMKDFEVKANNSGEVSEFEAQCLISDTRTRQKLALYVCLLHSLNTACSTLIYKSLYGIDINKVISAAKNCDEKVLEELLTIYTVAVNHPAFSFEQRSNLGSILIRLRQEESRLETERLAVTTNEEIVQSQASSDGAEELRPVTTTDLSPLSVPPGLTYPPGLNSGNIVQIPFYSPYPTQQMPQTSIVWQFYNYQHPLPTDNFVQPYSGSPHISHQSSPIQSASHSRAASPTRKAYPQRSERSDSLPKSRPTYGEAPYVNPPPNVKRTLVEVKDVPPKIDDEMSGLSERVADMSTEDMLRSAVVNLNGIVGSSVRITHVPLRQKPPTASSIELDLPPTGAAVFPTTVQAGPPVPPGVCTTPMQQPPPRYSQPGVCKHSAHAEDGSRHCSSSSGSDASSSSHSPPITPITINQNWEKAYHRDGPDSEDAALTSCNLQKHERPWPAMGRGRGRIGAPGVQTLPRERVPFASATRRDGPRSAPPTPQEDKKAYLVAPVGSDVAQASITAAVASTANILTPSNANKPIGHEMVPSGVPYATQFVSGPFAGPPVFPPFPHPFVRPPYTYPNGELMTYTYQPQPAFLPSPIVTYSSTVPPPKIACYNCSSQNHHPNDCKEPTMEEYSSKGQYRIDYSKSNEVLSSEK